MANFNSIRWSHNTDLSKSNVQQIFDNDKKLYDDIINTNGHTGQFALQEITTSTKYTLSNSKTFTSEIFSKIYYETIAADLTITLPNGISTLMFGCKALLDGSTGLVAGTDSLNQYGQLCGIAFGTIDTNNNLDNIYATFNNTGSGLWNNNRKNFFNAISGKTVVDYTNSGAQGEVKFNIFIWSIGKGDVQMMAQVNDNKHKLVNQFWVMRVD